MSFDVTVDTSGPFFSEAERHRIVDDYCRHIEEVIADRGVTLIVAYLPTQYMYLGHNGGDPVHNPIPRNAGYYQSQIATERASDNAMLVRDDRVVYGPWIEGVSEKNLRFWPGRVKRGLSPRFPGHHAFRDMTQVLNIEAHDIAQEELGRYVEDLNGRP